MKTERIINFNSALLEATAQAMKRDERVFVMGLGVPDPGGIFGSTKDLHKEFGEDRSMDMPLAENAMTGVVIGAALMGMRPILTHQRIDFALLSIEQIVNQAAKWHYMFNGQLAVPLVIRMIIGRGWGQGPQHSQSLQSFFAHIPGLKVIMPARPYDAKGMLLAAIEDNNPVICLEHRWLQNLKEHVPEEYYTVEIGPSRLAREGTDATIVATSHMVVESQRAAAELAEENISVEIIDLRTLAPLDPMMVLQSVRKTGRLIVADTGHISYGIGAEIVARVVEHHIPLKTPPVRVGLPDFPTPTSHALAAHYYPLAHDIANAVRRTCGQPEKPRPEYTQPLDVPDNSFTGPF